MDNFATKFNSRDSRRQLDYRKIVRSLWECQRYESENAFAAVGDSQELLELMPDNSVSLILTDPPYHATKKHNIVGDRDFVEDDEYLAWIAGFAEQWKRILKPNGSLFCFCDSSLAGRLEVLFSRQFNVLAHIVWTKPNEPGFDGWKGKMKKEALRSWYAHSERIIFAEPASDGNLYRAPFANYLREMRSRAGLSQHELTSLVGAFGRINHGGAVSNWEAGRNTPSPEQYAKICDAILATGKVGEMAPYEDIVRIFNVDKNREFTDVWNFPSVRPYRGKHPAEKPLQLLRHAIEATTLPGDVVLDCFAGSGNTAVAALEAGRRSASIEIDSVWIERLAVRLKAVEEPSQILFSRILPDPPKKRLMEAPTLFEDI